MSMHCPFRTLWSMYPPPWESTHLHLWLKRLFFSQVMSLSPWSKEAPGTSIALPEWALTRMQVQLRPLQLSTGTMQKSWLMALGSKGLYLRTPSNATALSPFSEVLNQKAFPIFSTLKSWSEDCLPNLSLTQYPSSSQTKLDWQLTISNSSSLKPTFSIIQSCPRSCWLGCVPMILEDLYSWGLLEQILRAWLPSWEMIWQMFPLGKTKACIISDSKLYHIFLSSPTYTEYGKLQTQSKTITD